MRRKRIRRHLILIILVVILIFVVWCFVTSSCSSAGCVTCGIHHGYRNSVVYKAQCEAKLNHKCYDCQARDWEGEIEVKKEFSDCIKRWWPEVKSSDLNKCVNLKEICLGYE